MSDHAMISPAHSHAGSNGDGQDQQHIANAYGSTESIGTKSPLHINLGFLKNLTERKTTRDGQLPKRRGPKPDSKPALTRRQELNRQAQRTHRERKELYIKALEEEVMRLKETYSRAVQDKNSYAKENQEIRELLQLHGIPFVETKRKLPSIGIGTSSYGGSSSDSRSGSYPHNQSFSPAETVGSGVISPASHNPPRTNSEQSGAQTLLPLHQGLDYDQIGIDFVLALEASCHSHQQFMCVRSYQEPTPELSGHALMATCPPRNHIIGTPDVPFPHRTWDIPNPDLMKLLDLSQNLPLDHDGEITPIMALKIIRSNDRFGELVMADFEVLKEDLKGKSRCYGFGAVLEEFEVRDALSGIFASKLESEKYAAFRFS